MEWLFSPWLQQLVLLVHISAALFWLGWMVFIFFILFPVLKQVAPEHFEGIKSNVQQRTRQFVFWIIVIIVITGLYNMGAVGLFDVEILLETHYGHRFLIKLMAALTLFGVYFLAPVIMNHGNDEGCGRSNGAPPVVGVILHIIAFGAGLTAAYLGLGL